MDSLRCGASESKDSPEHFKTIKLGFYEYYLLKVTRFGISLHIITNIMLILGYAKHILVTGKGNPQQPERKEKL
jgi:hypothetical protein